MRRANGTGSIYKMKHKNLRKPYRVVITIDYTDEGKAIRKTVGTFRTAKEAQNYLKDYNGNATEFIRGDITFETCWEWMIADKKRAGVDLKKGAYDLAKKKLKPLLKMPIKEIKLANLQNVMDIYSEQSRSSQIIILKAMNGVFEAAMKNDVVSKNPATNIILPAAKKSDMHKPFTEEEIYQLWQCDDWQSKITLIYIYTGLRPVELRKIKLADVNLKERYMTGGVKTTAGKNRIIPIADCIFDYVKELYTKAAFKDTLAAGMMSTHLYQKYMLGGHLPHDTRHTFATLTSRYKLDKLHIKLIMGHSTKSDITDDVYTHTTIEDLLATVNRLPTKNDLEKVVQQVSNG